MLLIILIFMFFSFALVGSVVIPAITKKFHRAQRKQVTKAGFQLENMFMLVPAKKLIILYTLSPLLTGGMCYLIFNKGIAFLVGMLAGFFLPELIIKQIEGLRRRKLQGQLVDALNTLSSSFKGGLSLLQAMEVVAEEMPPPISQEFSLVVRENKVGVQLDESLRRLNNRMKLEELELMINSILVARETGGDLTKVFFRLANALRDRQKLKEHITTLTLQGRIQGVVMSVLPIVFIIWVVAFNRHHFDIMLETDTGRMLILIAAFLQVVGMVLILKFSKADF